VRKCPDVKARAPSEGVVSMGMSGRLFKAASTSVKMVVNSSKFRKRGGRVFWRMVFIDFTPASQRREGPLDMLVTCHV